MGDSGLMEPALEVAIEIAVKKAKATAEKETKRSFHGLWIV